MVAYQGFLLGCIDLLLLNSKEKLKKDSNCTD